MVILGSKIDEVSASTYQFNEILKIAFLVILTKKNFYKKYKLNLWFIKKLGFICFNKYRIKIKKMKYFSFGIFTPRFFYNSFRIFTPRFFYIFKLRN